MENSDTERNQTLSVNHQTVFHMNPKTNGDFTEPGYSLFRALEHTPQQPNFGFAE